MPRQERSGNYFNSRGALRAKRRLGASHLQETRRAPYGRPCVNLRPVLFDRTAAASERESTAPNYRSIDILR